MPVSLTLEIRPGSPRHQKIIDAVRNRVQASYREFQKHHKKWRDAEERTLAYLPEREYDALRRQEREGGKPQYTTIQVPYTFAIIMAAHTYWTTVFMSRTPVLQAEGRHGEAEQSVQAIESLLQYQVQVGEMLVPLYIWLMDVGKYGFGVIGTYWDERYSMVSKIVEQEEMILGVVPTGKTKRIRTTERVKGYEGNTLYNVRPYDFYPDPRVTLANFQKGEFVAIYNEISYNEALKREHAGYYVNIERAAMGKQLAQNRTEGSAQLELPADEFDAPFMDGDVRGDPRKLKDPDVIPIFECFIELVPSTWELGKSELPEKWVFTITADYSTVIGAQPLGLIHDKFPFDVIELEPEGYALVNRGFPEVCASTQNTIDWLINSHFYGVRKALNNQIIMDPSRTVMKDWLSPTQGGIIRMKPAAYGTDPNTAWAQVQINDVTRNNMTDIGAMMQMGERITGVNDQIMGVLNQGGRKTAQEVRTASTFGINRLKTSAEYFSAMGWSPMTQKLIQNSQQLYTGEMKLKLVGDYAMTAGPSFINVTPDMIQGSYDFVPIDGTLPVDRFAQANLWRSLFADMARYPEIMMQYDVGRIFAWVAQLAGLKNINQFKVQVAPDAALAAQAQQGNVVAMKGGSETPSRVPEPGQIEGMGTTG